MLGFTIWSRKTIESDIFFWKPDKWFKIWFYIVMRVNHEDTKLFKRGTAYIEYKEISLKTKATYGEIQGFIRFAKTVQMISTQKSTRGSVFSVLNYAKYQDWNNYKIQAPAERASKHNPSTIHAIVERCKDDKDIYSLTLGITLWNARSHWPTDIPAPRNKTATKLLPTCRKVTPELITAWKKISPTQEDWESAVKAYILEIANRNPDNDYALHRFSLYDFIKQKNGYLKFLNR